MKKTICLMLASLLMLQGVMALSVGVLGAPYEIGEVEKGKRYKFNMTVQPFETIRYPNGTSEPNWQLPVVVYFESYKPIFRLPRAFATETYQNTAKEITLKVPRDIETGQHKESVCAFAKRLDKDRSYWRNFRRSINAGIGFRVGACAKVVFNVTK